MESIELKDRVILIVDDYVINTEMISLLVSDTGATPLTAANGRECVDIICKQPVDMIFMDQHMPVMDGLEATREIRSLPNGKRIPIIGISASEDDVEKDQCLEAGMNMVVNKLTLNFEKICEIVERLIGDPNGKSEDTTDHTIEKEYVDVEPSNIDDDIMDYVKAVREFENDTDLVHSLMEDFLKNCISQVNNMKEFFKNGDFQSIQRESHGIKGGAANLCAMPLSDTAKALEIACKKHESPDTVIKLLNDLNRAVESFGIYVKKKLY